MLKTLKSVRLENDGIYICTTLSQAQALLAPCLRLEVYDYTSQSCQLFSLLYLYYWYKGRERMAEAIRRSD